ncbi:AraC family transcriptional regulator [Aureibaculum sp. 2210JD6-5]|uniref:helix-turn-helix domain-containing protein n=1 Tax=Aureibaculum sp. 2210JD6-5 TaxID=3103957 RepID=UPI002AAD7924|nr:AraC family transcriptional regulator [Aureibaculum sp. 2210JD6-5]MDY7394993.1 AraC family transcriptional regulator [Aureibaculum sp. 2210JD6-5]
MKTTYIKTSKIGKIFNELHKNFGGKLNISSNEYNLDLNGQLGSGNIKGFSFKNGISYLEFDITLNDNFTLSINATERLPIYFAYCAKGSLSHRFGAGGKQNTLKKYQTGVLTCKRAEENVLTFKKDEPTKISLIVVNTITSELAEGVGLNQKLRDTFFENSDTKESSVYIGSYNLKIGEKIKELSAIKQTGIVRNLMIESTVHMILALEIQQRLDDLRNVENPTGNLTTREMDTIKELSEFIINYPENDYTLKTLSKKSGLSTSKLQEGFKILHNRTVRDFIINERMKKSERLIRTTDLNISEVVYSIGFTSRSYFSKIFKQKYNCSPKFYKDNQNSIAVTA